MIIVGLRYEVFYVPYSKIGIQIAPSVVSSFDSAIDEASNVEDDEFGETEETSGCWEKYFPDGFWNEWKQLAKLAIPIVSFCSLSAFCRFLQSTRISYFKYDSYYFRCFVSDVHRCHQLSSCPGNPVFRGKIRKHEVSCTWSFKIYLPCRWAIHSSGTSNHV